MTHVFGRRKRFRDGEERLASAEEKNDAALVTSFTETLQTYRRQTILELANLHDVAVGRAHLIMIKELKMRRGIKDSLLQLYNIIYILYSLIV